MWEGINNVRVVCQTDGVAAGALMLIFKEILIKGKGLKLNPVSITYFVSPCSALCLFIRQILLNKPKMDVVGVFMENRFMDEAPCLFYEMVSVDMKPQSHSQVSFH